MNVYVFSKPDSEDLQTPIFATGDNGNGESAMVFTESNLASKFRTVAGWQDQETVVELDAIPFLKWLTQLQEAGARYLVVDPDPADYERSAALPTISIDDQLNTAARQLIRRVRVPGSNSTAVSSSVRIYHCHFCGITVEQRLGNVTPACCNSAMRVDAPTAIEA